MKFKVWQKTEHETEVILMLKKWFSLLVCIALILSGTASCFASAEADAVASDYSDTANWLALPTVSKEVDTFYIYPTAVNDASEGAPVICGIDSAMLHEGAKGCYESQATVYETATNVLRRIIARSIWLR